MKALIWVVLEKVMKHQGPPSVLEKGPAIKMIEPKFLEDLHAILSLCAKLCMRTPFFLSFLVLAACPLPIDPIGMPVVTGIDEGPYIPVFCPGIGKVHDDMRASICEAQPFAWKAPCDQELQPCEEFLLELGEACQNKVTTCDYEICSQALQEAACGDWPDACQELVSCWPPGADPTDSGN